MISGSLGESYLMGVRLQSIQKFVIFSMFLGILADLGLFPPIEFCLTHVNEVIDELLTKDYSCGIALPRVQKR